METEETKSRRKVLKILINMIEAEKKETVEWSSELVCVGFSSPSAATLHANNAVALQLAHDALEESYNRVDVSL